MPVEELAQKAIDKIRGRDVGGLARRVQGVRNRILRRRLTDLSAEHLRQIEARIEDTSEHIVETVEEMENKGEQALADGDWRRFEVIRSELTEAARDYDELQDLRKNVVEARYEVSLNDALAARLGGVTRRKLYDGLIMVLITLVVVMLLYELMASPATSTRVILDWIDVGCCLVFLADFAWRHRLAESKKWFWKRYWIDFITSIPLPSAHTLRLGRTVRLVRLLRMLRFVRFIRIFRVVLFLWRGMDKLAATFDVRLMRRSINLLAATLLLGGLGIWILEGNPDLDQMGRYGEWVWWSFTTVVTGGYGDIHNPVSLGGRLLTVALVIAGMVVVGIFTATLTSLLVRENDASGAILALEDRMLDELSEIRQHLGIPEKDQPRPTRSVLLRAPSLHTKDRPPKPE